MQKMTSGTLFQYQARKDTIRMDIEQLACIGCNQESIDRGYNFRGCAETPQFIRG